METVAEPPDMPPHAQREEEFQQEEPTFVHARPTRESRRERRSYRNRFEALPPEPPSVNAPVGAWTVIETVARWWLLIFLAAIAGMLAGYFFGKQYFQTGYVATVEIM